ncbi:hypothetical protein HDU85_000188 [Gaertneriomyces sp. JEL0708]|nr:hypothetical protein HDU85_000188 [Gaertneriomyces sp. JEL0708]
MRSFEWTVLGNDLGVVASSDRNAVVEDLHLKSGRGRRCRVVRHRAKKRARGNAKKAADVPIESNTAADVNDFPELNALHTVQRMMENPFHSESYKEALLSVPPVAIPHIPVRQPCEKQLGSVARAFKRLSVYPTAQRKVHMKSVPVMVKPQVDTGSSFVTRLTARPVIDLCRDRRRRITSIKRHITALASRKEIARNLNAIRVQRKSGTANTATRKVSLQPLWARFDLSWNSQESGDRFLIPAVIAA